jgi:hypothetical protein
VSHGPRAANDLVGKGLSYCGVKSLSTDLKKRVLIFELGVESEGLKGKVKLYYDISRGQSRPKYGEFGKLDDASDRENSSSEKKEKTKCTVIPFLFCPSANSKR